MTSHSASTRSPAISPASAQALSPEPGGWTRRTWLTRTATALLVPGLQSERRRRAASGAAERTTSASAAAGQARQAARIAVQAAQLDPTRFETLARQAVEAATSAGAHYADARLTRTVQHHYGFSDDPAAGVRDVETVGVGVRALVDGYWGFASSTAAEPDEVVRLAREAVAEAQVSAKGSTGPVRRVELGQVPAVTGRWTTPVTLDPFAVSLDEKADFLTAWNQLSHRYGAPINLLYSYLYLARQERTVATSEGSCVSQTLYESGGCILCGQEIMVPVRGIEACGKGWELFLDAKIPEQLAAMREQIAVKASIGLKPATIGRYTVVCDGAMMARVVAQTFGIATQLDRALGYEANAGGTSFITDPLGMVGALQVASPQVTVTANRSAPGDLATVHWDEEAVVPESATLVKHGILHDFQTTREQATWLAPYYQKAGLPVRSHGYASTEDGASLPLQHMPNLVLEPGPADVHLEDLIADVTDGILVMDAPDPYGTSFAARTDQQAKNGYFGGEMRQIKNGKLGPGLANGAILFNTQDFWKHVKVLGGLQTQGVYASTALEERTNLYRKFFQLDGCKGQPPQLTSHTVRAVAAAVPEQALIDLRRKA